MMGQLLPLLTILAGFGWAVVALHSLSERRTRIAVRAGEDRQPDATPDDLS